MPSSVSLRALNRATLARQLLLERAELDPVTAVERLAGLQAQTPQTWYTGLWSRLAGFDPEAVSAAMLDGELVRLAVMRSTIHLVAVADAVAMRALVDPVIERNALGQYGRTLRAVDRAALEAATRELTGARPMIASELGRALAERFPGLPADALAYGARAWVPLVQPPPRGLWGRSGKPVQAPLDGRGHAPYPVQTLVRRYLAAFGPASVRDVQLWSGLTRLAEVLDGMRAELVVLHTDDGRELFDLPEAPRPDAGTPAPARFLYDFDNLLLSHADRSRVVGPPGAIDYAAQGFAPPSNEQPSSLLLDGFVAGTWKATAGRGPEIGAATLTVRPFRTFTASEEDDVVAEGAALLGFLHPRAAPEVRIS